MKRIVAWLLTFAAASISMACSSDERVASTRFWDQAHVEGVSHTYTFSEMKDWLRSYPKTDKTEASLGALAVIRGTVSDVLPGAAFGLGTEERQLPGGGIEIVSPRVSWESPDAFHGFVRLAISDYSVLYGSVPTAGPIYIEIPYRLERQADGGFAPIDSVRHEFMQSTKNVIVFLKKWQWPLSNDIPDPISDSGMLYTPHTDLQITEDLTGKPIAPLIDDSGLKDKLFKGKSTLAHLESYIRKLKV